VYPTILNVNFVCLSVRPSVRPFVSRHVPYGRTVRYTPGVVMWLATVRLKAIELQKQRKAIVESQPRVTV
jgi:hypothetical protein